MPRRIDVPITDPNRGLTFRFAFEAGEKGLLHIETRHGATPTIAIETYLAGVTIWNGENKRFEPQTESHSLYWA